MASQKVGFLYTPESKYKAYKLESDDENTVKKITALKESQLNEKMDEGKINSEFEKEILKVLKAKFDLDPTTATIDFGPNGMSIKPVNYQVWADKFTKGNQGRNGNYVDDKAQKIAAYFNKKYGKNLVAEEGQMNEITDAVSWEAVAAAMTAMGLAPLAIDKMHKWWEKKYPKSFKAAQKISGTIDRQMGGNTPGQGHGVDTSKTFGPQNEKNALKEYENDDYRVVNGQCRRYNDEHEYTVVSMSYCR